MCCVKATEFGTAFIALSKSHGLPGVDIIEENDQSIKYRFITETKKTVQEMGEKGQVISNTTSDFFTVEERIDYGFNQRKVYDEIDAIHKWLVRLKEAINQANRTVLAELP